MQLVDPEAWTLGTAIALQAPPTAIAAGTSTVVVGLGSQMAVYPALPAVTSNMASASAIAPVTAIDVDEVRSQALLGGASGSRDLMTLILPTTIVNTLHVPAGSFPCCQALGVATDANSDPFVSFDQGQGFVQGIHFMQTGGNGSHGCATDRVRHRAVVPGTTRIVEYDLTNDSQLNSLMVNTTGFIGINPAVWGNLVAMIVTGAAPSGVTLVDMSGLVVGGDIDVPRARNCSQGDRVAVDPSRNRAFVTNSCSQKLEGYNLNVVFVK